MDEIAKQYKAFGYLCLELAIAAQFFALFNLVPFTASATTGANPLLRFLAFVLTNSALYLVIAKAPMMWFEKLGWKLFNPKVNVEGRWCYSVVYYPPDIRLLKKEGQERLHDLIQRLKDNHGEVWIDQTIFGVSVQEGAGYLGEGPTALKTTWKGSSVSITKTGNVLIHYTSNLGGVKFNGIDDLTVVNRDKAKRPVKMFGHFVMVPEGSDFVLRGEITYAR